MTQPELASAWRLFNDQIQFEAALRWQLQALPADAIESLAGGRMQVNASLLETLLALDKPKRALLVDDERGDYASEFQLISARLDLVMSVLSQLAPAAPDARHQLSLNPYGICVAPELIGELRDQACLVRLYFDHCPAVPLELAGWVAPEPAGFIALYPLPTDVHDGIERLVFTQHRRQIAAARQK